MPETHIHINEGSIRIILDVQKIQTFASGYNPALILGLNFNAQMKSPENKPGLNLLGYEAKLKFKNFIISSFSSFLSREVYDKFDSLINLEMPLDSLRLAKVESERRGSIKFTLEVIFHFAKYESLTLPVAGKNSSHKFISGFTWGNGILDFEIPQSQWIESILPGLGFKTFRVIELPETSELIPKEYAKSNAELDEASKYLKLGEYDKVVAHCRTALEPIRSRFPDLKKWVKQKEIVNESIVEWTEAITNSSLRWIDDLFKVQADITNKTHHVPSIGHFSRHEAEAIYLLTVSIISIGGRIDDLKTIQS